MARLLLHTLAAVLLAALACGCSADDAAGGGVPSGDTQVSFILKLSDASGRTRAAWSEDYVGQQGTAYDNRISPEDLRVALYTADGNMFAAEVDILSYHETATEGEYELIGTVKSADGGAPAAGRYKVMVFANCGVSGQSDPLASLRQSPYHYDAEAVKGGSQLVPMWGVTTAELSLEKGKRDKEVEIDLLRAFAKVEISLHSDISETTDIVSATLTCYNTGGYCLPAGYAGVSKTADLDQENGDNPSFNPDQTAQQTNLDFTYSGDKKSAYLYIPEYDNSAEPAEITLELSDGTKGTLEFKTYTGGTPGGEAYDIVRNHIYRYTVNVYQGELQVECKVMPWQLVMSSIGWMPQPASTTENPFASEDSYQEFLDGNNYILLPRQSYDGSNRKGTRKLLSSLYTDPKSGDIEGCLDILYRPAYDEKDSSRKTFKDDLGSAGARFFFVFTGPEGATWEAHLTNTADFGFSTSSESVFNTSNSEWKSEGDVRMVTHGRARSKPYVIQVIALNNYTGTDKEGNVNPDDLPKDHKPLFEDDAYLTPWGKDKWYGHKVVDTEFYITVRLADGTEYELTINPSYDGNKDFEDGDFYYKERRRFAGTDTRVWIRQVRAQYGIKNYEELAKDISPTDPSFEWWRVNPYWR